MNKLCIKDLNLGVVLMQEKLKLYKNIIKHTHQSHSLLFSPISSTVILVSPYFFHSGSLN